MGNSHVHPSFRDLLNVTLSAQGFAPLAKAVRSERQAKADILAGKINRSIQPVTVWVNIYATAGQSLDMSGVYDTEEEAAEAVAESLTDGFAYVCTAVTTVNGSAVISERHDLTNRHAEIVAERARDAENERREALEWERHQRSYSPAMRNR